MPTWSLRKVLMWLILLVGGFALPWQQTLMGFVLPPQLHELSTDPETREQQLRSAVRKLDKLGNVFPYGRGSMYVKLAAIETGRGRHQVAAQLLRRGLQFEPQPLDVRLSLVRSTVLAGGSDSLALAAAYLHDISRFASPHEAGDINWTARQLGLPQPWTEYVVPAVRLAKPVSIVVLGDIPQRTVESITRKLEQTLGATVIVRADPSYEPITKNRLGHGSLQFEVDDLAKSVAAAYSDALDARAFSARLVIVDVDIFAFGLNYVYASMTKDRSSLISLYRFQDANPDLVRDRSTKQALTSLLDQIGTDRPSHSSCVNANNAGGITFDRKSDVICSETLLAVSRRQQSPTRTSQVPRQ